MGRLWKIPLALELTKQVFCYYEHLQKLEFEGSDSLVSHVYCEQRHLNLAWYNKLTELRQTIQDRVKNHVNYPSQMRKSLHTTFCEIWEAERKTYRKLGFYNSIKETFGCETYLNIGLSYQEQKRLAQFRTSSHRYIAETGRYKQKHESVKSWLISVPYHSSSLSLKTRNTFSSNVLNTEKWRKSLLSQ